MRAGSNPRQPIYAMIAAGFVVSLAMALAPYALRVSARRAAEDFAPAAVNRLAPADAAKPTATARPTAPAAPALPAPPAFDAAAWYESRGEDLETRGLLIEPLDGSRTLAAHNEGQTFNPASLVKLATTLAALKRLGADYRFETRVYLRGEVDRSGTLTGRIHVAGSDPTFGDVAGVLIAKELERRGVRRLGGELVVSPEFSFNHSEKPEDSAARLAKVMRLSPKRLGAGEAPEGEPDFVARSYPLRDILFYMNARSNNFMAHRVGALLGGAEGVREFLVAELGLPAAEVALETTSGLGHNRMTPRGMLTVIRALRSEAERQGLSLRDLMPVAGGDYGTLRRRFVGTPLEGVVVGKTGTLVHDDGGMASLGGVVYTLGHGEVCFVFFNVGSGVALSRQSTDQLLAEVVLGSDEPAPTQTPVAPRRQLDSRTIEIRDE
ncbi:MAG TPA: D-alanyl-D-alanine carboxypeptidase [Pyrinomonadaceae bacterium]|nr:D-alanyl-D-alanine carboxypeptidase [Pyrinomonadaceae bacterium]